MRHLILTLLFASTSGSAILEASEITIKGSDTMVVLCQKFADAFIKGNPEIKVQVTGGGSGTGIAALLNGTTDIASSSRSIKPNEVATAILRLGDKPEEIAVALDGIGIYVHESNPIKSLSMQQLDAIFIGKVKNWKEVGGPDLALTIYSRENNSGTYAFFKEHVLGEKDFAPAAQTMAGTAALISAVSNDKRGIGYGGIAYAANVRIIPVSADSSSAAVMPDEAHIMDGTYPISRKLFLYTNPKSVTPTTDAFLAFCRGEAGQKIVSQVGYFPMKTDVAKLAENMATTGGTPNTPMITADSEAILTQHLDIVKREESFKTRELDIAKREAEVASREMSVASREGNAAKREADCAEKEAALAKREEISSAPRARTVGN